MNHDAISVQLCLSAGLDIAQTEALLDRLKGVPTAPAGADKAYPRPVARIKGIDEYGPLIEWTKHWVDVGVGTSLFAGPVAVQPDLAGKE